MSESTDNPTLDVEALAELIAAADLTLPIQMEYRFSAELMCDVGTMIVGNGVEARIHTVQTALLIEAALNQLPALLAKLARVTAALTEAEAAISNAQDALTPEHPVFWVLDDYDGSMDSVRTLAAQRDKWRLARDQMADNAAHWQRQYEQARAEQGRIAQRMAASLEPFVSMSTIRQAIADANPTAAPKATCGHQHARFLRQPGDQPILCTLPANHDGDHGEPETRSHWDRNSNFGYVATGDPRALKPAVAVPGAGSGETTDGEVAR